MARLLICSGAARDLQWRGSRAAVARLFAAVARLFAAVVRSFAAFAAVALHTTVVYPYIMINSHHDILTIGCIVRLISTSTPTRIVILLGKETTDIQTPKRS